MVEIAGTGQRPAYLMAIHFDQVAGAVASAVESSGNVRFTVEVTELKGPVLRVTAEALAGWTSGPRNGPQPCGSIRRIAKELDGGVVVGPRQMLFKSGHAG